MACKTKTFDFKKYYNENKERYERNLLRYHILKSLKKPKHKFGKSITPEKIQQVIEESRTIKRGHPWVYKTNEERKAARTKVRNEITYRYMKKRKLYNDELNRLMKIGNVFEETVFEPKPKSKFEIDLDTKLDAIKRRYNRYQYMKEAEAELEELHQQTLMKPNNVLITSL